MAIWVMAAAYFFLLPPVYHSKWSFILPVGSNGSTVSLETIGQTSTSPSHPFGSVSLSPKVIYKEIATSEQVLEAAAKSMGLQVQSFGKPRVTLIDETSLMMFKMSGRSPEQARDKAAALMKAFEVQLDQLRRDEQERRALLVSENLKIYRANLENVRQRMFEYRRMSGLSSVDQFKEALITAELLRRKLADLRADQLRLVREQRTLTSHIGLSPQLAATGIRLASDPAFAQLAKIYSEARAEVFEGSVRYGPNHPKLSVAKMKVKGLLGELRRVAGSAGVSQDSLSQMMLILNQSNQSDLLKNIVSNEGALEGKNREVQSLEEQLAEIEVKVAGMGKAAARLEALQKDHLVAEAVFTSAAARLDIGRTDVFASYPMVQVLAQPDLPANRSQPRLIYALAAGILGTFLVLFAWGAAWLRVTLRRKR
ncbi:MAG: hypothetical protein KKB37_13755 [Alphaproteobacteria bacterium]|nr:hypothetical protein [Alphaproteobacteria bacterium]